MQYYTSALVLALASIVNTQSIDPNSVPLATRQNWCTSQISACPLLCTQQTASGSATTRSNTCDAKSLAWTCVCQDGTTPNVANYSQTVPFYECQEFGNQCVTNCGNNNAACASNCRTQYPCGAQNPTKVNATSTSSTSTASATGSSKTDAGTFGGADSSGSSSTSSSSSSTSGTSSSQQKTSAANTVVAFGRSYGVAVLAGAIFAGFGFAL